MKHLILILVLFLSITTFAQIDTGETKNGSIIYERVFDESSVDIEQSVVIDDKLSEVIEHRGVFRIGSQQNFHSFPYQVVAKYEAATTLIYVTVNYKIIDNKIVITAKNSVDDLVFPIGIQYYIVVRYTRK